MLHNSDKIQFINKVITFSGIALLVLFFMPTIQVTLLWRDTEIVSLCQLAAKEDFGQTAPMAALLFFLSLEMAMSGAELPRLSLCCAICHLALSVYVLISVNSYLDSWGSATPSLLMLVCFALPCTIIFLIISESIKSSRKQKQLT